MSLTKFAIRNQSVLDILEEFRYTYRERFQPENTNPPLAPEQQGMADQYTDETEMHRIVNMGEDHDGSASNGYSHPLKPDHYRGEVPSEYRDVWVTLDFKLRSELGVETSALSQLYPPGGFIGWHNNANASAHNLIFTWSETGDGWFKYIDPKTSELVTVQDEVGWNLKAGYFGAYGSDDVVYHAARTNCWRMTLSYVLGHNTDYWQDCIDYVTNI